MVYGQERATDAGLSQLPLGERTFLERIYKGEEWGGGVASPNTHPLSICSLERKPHVREGKGSPHPTSDSGGRTIRWLVVILQSALKMEQLAHLKQGHPTVQLKPDSSK